MKRTMVSEAGFMRELYAFFGPRRAAALLGKAAVLALYGAKTRADVPSTPVLSMATRYRFLADVRSFHDHLEARGLDWERTVDAEGRVLAIVQLMEAGS